MSVAATVRFFTAPSAPYEVQCFFISRDEKTNKQSIFDADKRQSQNQSEDFDFESDSLAGTARTTTVTPITENIYSSNGVQMGTADRSYYSTTTTKGSRMDGWVVRVVSQGTVLRVESNQPSLKGFAEKSPQVFDTIAEATKPKLK